MYQSNMAPYVQVSRQFSNRLSYDGHARLMVKPMRNFGTVDYKHCHVYKEKCCSYDSVTVSESYVTSKCTGFQSAASCTKIIIDRSNMQQHAIFHFFKSVSL